MSRVKLAVAAAVASLVVLPVPAGAAKFANCAALNKVYPHGVGKPGARDKTSGRRVTNFKVSRKLYEANRSKDRDKDGIACEKR